MRFYDSSLPVTPTPVFDVAFFARATETQVIVRDQNGNPVKVNGVVQTRPGELRDLLVPMAGDRAAALAQAVRNQARFVEEGNDWVGALNRTGQEMERVRPTGVNKDKTAKVDINGFSFNDNGGSVTISAEAAATLFNLIDDNGVRLLFKYFNFSSSDLTNYLNQFDLAEQLRQIASGLHDFPGFTTTVSITSMKENQAFSVFDADFKSRIDSATQTVQLDQTTLQGLISRQNNAIETMADLQNKFTQTHSKLVGNLRPPQ
jgi:hypothetical protein